MAHECSVLRSCRPIQLVPAYSLFDLLQNETNYLFYVPSPLQDRHRIMYRVRLKD